jgi:hypothetical protein
MSEGMHCTHRECVVPKLLLLFKIASEHAPEGMTEDEILNIGVRGLAALGVSPEELVEGSLILSLSSPLVSDVENESPVSTWD